MERLPCERHESEISSDSPQNTNTNSCLHFHAVPFTFPSFCSIFPVPCHFGRRGRGGEGWNPPDPLRGHSFTDMTETEASHLVRLRKSAFTKINLCCLGDRAVLLRVIKNDLMRASKQAAVVMKARKTSFQSAFLPFSLRCIMVVLEGGEQAKTQAIEDIYRGSRVLIGIAASLRWVHYIS